MLMIRSTNDADNIINASADIDVYYVWDTVGGAYAAFEWPFAVDHGDEDEVLPEETSCS